MIFNNIFKQNKPIKTRTLYPYEKEYHSLIGKTITIDDLNLITERLSEHYNQGDYVEIHNNSYEFIPFTFNLLTVDVIIELSIEQELTPDDRLLLFDVIEYQPTDYKLCLSIELLNDGKIRITDVGVES